MDKAYNPTDVEEKLYKHWEESGYFTPKMDPTKKPFTIVLPPPNASGKMHTGNVLMIAIEDLLVRWHRMKGEPTLWIPGTDHAGFETQTTFERELKKQGKSRFDFDRQTLYQMIWDFVKENKVSIENQIRRMGASVDWSRNRFTLDKEVVDTVYQTFRKMIKDNLIHRGEYMVNFCVNCGTTFADLEINHIERTDALYYVKYTLLGKRDGEPEYIEVATVRPEPIMIDTHLAVNPQDKKHAYLIGRKVQNPLTMAEMDIIADPFVDPAFGTGIVKLTPGHDKNDYEVALKHKLPIKTVIDWSGRMNEEAGEFKGLKVKEARKQVVQQLIDKGFLDETKTNHQYLHSVSVCYKAGHDIEPTVMPNWFVRVDDSKKSLKKPAYDVVKNGAVKIYPKWQEKTYLRWMEEMRDWPISRQIVWGISIPVMYEIKDASQFRVSFLDKSGVFQQAPLDHFLSSGVTLDEIKAGLQRVYALPGVSWVLEEDMTDEKEYLPETDTFDTWFSSGQWPLVTLGYPDGKDFEYFYPTAVLETGWEIIRLWVSRMIMLGIYLTGKPPFEYVYLHGIVRALDGRKMSKSLGNVINPEEYIQQYGVDALRMGLISGTANGKDFAFPKDRVVSYKHFANKIWNMARFMLLMREQYGQDIPLFTTLSQSILSKEDKRMIKEVRLLIKQVDASLEKFRFADAGERIYQFMWHELADIYIEQIKGREDKDIALSVLEYVFITCLKLLHPFMPFVTEEIYLKMPNAGPSIMVEPWPTI